MEFTGHVSKKDLTGLMKISDIILIPIIKGSGVRIKLLEAAACSSAIVSTVKGVEGLNFDDEKEVLISEGVDHSFVGKVKRLISDSDLRKRLGLNARKKVKENYSWGKGVQKYQEMYDALIN